MIRVITYNCQGLKSSIHDIQALCSSYDLIFIQDNDNDNDNSLLNINVVIK